MINNQNKQQEIATLGGGCFWCLEAVFGQLEGVKEVISGYSGGESRNPSYREVCSGITGHAEVIQITFESSLISYQELLGVFFSLHDPTTLNRQGNDVGSQYRSVIFFHNAVQQSIANQVIKDIETIKLWPNPVVTEVEKYSDFYPAEDYHQEYYQRNKYLPYCQVVIAPKLAKFRKLYKDRIR